MKKLFILAVLSFIIISLNIITVYASAPIFITKESCGSGSIWTTRNDCGSEQQNVNHYDVGEKIYINGRNFAPGDYNWDIKGQPGQASCDPNSIVASNSLTVAQTGNFCFEVYTVANDDCGEYKVTFGCKHDNYHVIPEFGIIAGILTMLSAVVAFFVIRRR